MEQIKSLSDLQSLFKRQVANKHISTCPYGGPQPYLKPNMTELAEQACSWYRTWIL